MPNIKNSKISWSKRVYMGFLGGSLVFAANLLMQPRLAIVDPGTYEKGDVMCSVSIYPSAPGGNLQKAYCKFYESSKVPYAVRMDGDILPSIYGYPTLQFLWSTPEIPDAEKKFYENFDRVVKPENRTSR